MHSDERTMTVLLLDPDTRLVKALTARLGCDAVVLGPSGVAKAIALAGAGRLDAVLGEALHLSDLAAFASMGVPCGLWTSNDVDDLIGPARAAGISLIATKTQPLLLDEILMALGNWMDGLGTGVERYLGGDGIRLGAMVVEKPGGVADACRAVLASLSGPLGDSRRLRLVLDELMTNTLHHGGGAAATVEWGSDGVKHVFIVRDPAGRLSPDEILGLLDRRLRGEGLLDPRGRGLHLSRIYADRLYVSVVPGLSTESAAVFWNHPGAYQGHKPVWVQKIKRTRGE